MKTYVKPVPKMGLFSEGRGVGKNTALVGVCKESRSVKITAVKTNFYGARGIWFYY
jgi:hypothetical protein